MEKPQEQISGENPGFQNKKVELGDVLDAVKAILKIDLRKDQKSRKRPLIDARRIFCMISREHTSHTIARIGMTIGKDHATAIYYFQTGENFLTHDPQFLDKHYKTELYILNNHFDFNKKSLLSDIEKFVGSHKGSKDPFVIGLRDLYNNHNLKKTA